MPYKNPEARKNYLKKYDKKRWEQNKSILNDRHKKWKNINPEKSKQYKEKWRNIHYFDEKRIIGEMLTSAKRRANKKNIEFNLQISDIKIPAVCPVLGIKIFKIKNKLHDGSPSLDRIDPNKGYTKDNTHVISYRANSIKRDATLTELEKIYTYFKNI